MNVKAIEIPKGYEFDKIEGNKIILVRKQEDLDTWEGCISFLKEGEFIDVDSEIVPFKIKEEHQLRPEEDKNVIPVNMGEAMLALCQLLICRNAWWEKLNWKPNWKDKRQHRHCIGFVGEKFIVITDERCNRILAFPSEENCRRFLNVFRGLIEKAKELL